jgi:hypothetical protein
MWEVRVQYNRGQQFQTMTRPKTLL